MTPKLDVGKVQGAYKNSVSRMFFLDYDGTLSPIVTNPSDATPTKELLKLLSSLSADPHNKIYIISGRDRKFLQNWVGELPIGLSAEHGAFLKPIENDNNSRSEWKDMIEGKHFDLRWKEEVIAAFQKFCDKVPKAHVEKKEYAITLHYRSSDKAAVKEHKTELIAQLDKYASTHKTLDVRKGKKSLEARIQGITKGFIITEILNSCERGNVDFVMCMGDDVTDEDMFVALAREPNLRNVFTCTVGKKDQTASNIYLDKQSEVIETLHALADVTAS